jgi:hypothetical protein
MIDNTSLLCYNSYMKANTHNQIETSLIVTRDGSPDAEYIRKQRITAAMSHFQAISGALLAKVGEYASDVYTPVKLDILDHTLGSDLRQQYFDKQRASKLAQATREFEL